MNLKELSMIELKAFAYDHIAQIEASQKTLNQLNQEIAFRIQNPVDAISAIQEKSELNSNHVQSTYPKGIVSTETKQS